MGTLSQFAASASRGLRGLEVPVHRDWVSGASKALGLGCRVGEDMRNVRLCGSHTLNAYSGNTRIDEYQCTCVCVCVCVDMSPYVPAYEATSW